MISTSSPGRCARTVSKSPRKRASINARGSGSVTRDALDSGGVVRAVAMPDYRLMAFHLQESLRGEYSHRYDQDLTGTSSAPESQKSRAATHGQGGGHR